MAKLLNPTVYAVPNPINLDLALKRIQNDLSAVPWLEKIFGRARTVNRSGRDAGRYATTNTDMRPMVYLNNGEYYPSDPNDALVSQSFFRVWGPQGVDDFSSMKNVDFAQTEMDLIVSGNLKKINPDIDYYYTEILIKDVMAAIRKNSDIEVLKIFDERPNEIWRGYTISESKLHLLMYPFFAFRINFNLRYQMECYAISDSSEGTGIFDPTFDETFE